MTAIIQASLINENPHASYPVFGYLINAPLMAIISVRFLFFDRYYSFVAHLAACI
jgi:hypothetical protein